MDVAYADESSQEIETVRTLRDCYDEGHQVVEDTLVETYCVERLFHCLDCKVSFVCVEEQGEVRTRSVVPGMIGNEEISKYVTWL